MSPQFGEEVQILSKLPKQYQILFQSGFNCSILLQRVRLGVVALVPHHNREESSPLIIHIALSASPERALGCNPLSGILLHAH